MPIHHSSGSFSLDLPRALEHVAGGSPLLSPSEAVASLLVSLRMWMPDRVDVEQKSRLKLIAHGPRCQADPLSLVIDLALGKRLPDAFCVRHFAVGLRSLLRHPDVAVGLWNGSRVQTFSGTIKERGHRDTVEFVIGGISSLDVAAIRRRLRFSPLPILVDGKPLPMVSAAPCSADFVWEAFQLSADSPTDPTAFAAWSGGWAALDVGLSDLNQPRTNIKGKVQVVGRFFSPPGSPVVSEYPNLYSEYIFRSALTSRMRAPACIAACSLELRPRSRSHWRGVSEGFVLDACEFGNAPPGWRVWVAVPWQAVGAGMRGLENADETVAREALRWGQEWFAKFESRIRDKRKALRL